MTLFDGNDIGKSNGVMNRFFKMFGAQRAGIPASEIDSAVSRRPRTHLTTFLAITATIMAVSACGATDSKNYDISPLFPLSANKCAKYGGTVEGVGITAHCWVNKAQCDTAAADWHKAMRNVPDAIEFTC